MTLAQEATPQATPQVTLQVTPQATAQATEQATEQASEQTKDRVSERILAYCSIPRARDEIMAYLGLRHREHFRSEILLPLIEAGLLLRAIPNKPNSPRQKYVAKKEGDGTS